LISAGKLLRGKRIYRRKNLMQTTKLLSVIGLVAAFLAFAPNRGTGDTQAQIKAREALRQKIAELEGSPASPPKPAAPQPPPAPATPAKPATPPAPVAAPQSKAPVAPVAPAPVFAAVPAATAPSSSIFGPVPDAVENENTARAREALRQQMAFEFGPVPDAVEDANTARARAAMRAEMALLQRTPAVPMKPGRSTASTALIASTPLVMEVPPYPLTGSKAARMAELLQRYNADQITPKEYHTQRAAILAEP
jgi:hypothetical protein